MNFKSYLDSKIKEEILNNIKKSRKKKKEQIVEINAEHTISFL